MLENICTSARCAMSLCGTYFTPVQTYNSSLPFTTTHVERMFSSLKLIKTDRRTNMSNTTLSDLMEVYHEGPSLQYFHAEATIQLLWEQCKTDCCPNQGCRKQYRARKTGE